VLGGFRQRESTRGNTDGARAPYSSYPAQTAVQRNIPALPVYPILPRRCVGVRPTSSRDPDAPPGANPPRIVPHPGSGGTIIRIANSLEAKSSRLPVSDGMLGLLLAGPTRFSARGKIFSHVPFLGLKGLSYAATSHFPWLACPEPG
jgi:hypothetical protein